MFKKALFFLLFVVLGLVSNVTCQACDKPGCPGHLSYDG